MGREAEARVSRTHGTARENSARAPTPCALAPPFREAWTATPVYGPLAHDGLLFVNDSKDHPAALDAKTGKRVWTSPWLGGIALIHEGHLFLKLDPSEIHVVDPHSGRPEAVLHAPHGNMAGIGRRLIGCVVDYEYDAIVTWALDWTTGERLWSVRERPAGAVSQHFCASERGFVYEIEDRSGASRNVKVLVARRIETGEELWRRRNAELQSVASIFEDRVVACVGDRAMALDLASGAVLWEVEGGAGYLYGDRYYVLKWSADGPTWFCTIDVRTGKTLRRVDVRAKLPKTLKDAGLASLLLVTDTHVFAKSPKNALIVFDRESGEYAWQHHPSGAHIMGEVVCGDGCFYYRNGTERLFCLESAAR